MKVGVGVRLRLGLCYRLQAGEGLADDIGTPYNVQYTHLWSSFITNHVIVRTLHCKPLYFPLEDILQLFPGLDYYIRLIKANSFAYIKYVNLGMYGKLCQINLNIMPHILTSCT